MGDIINLYPQQTKDMDKQTLKTAIERVCEKPEMKNPVDLSEAILNLIGRQFPFPVGKLAQVLGFEIGEQKIDNKNLSGYIACDDSLKPYTRIIRLNSEDSLGHKRFTIAHELWHYFENFDEIDCKAKNGGFYSSYRTDQADHYSEQLANAFAANLLMPKNEYMSTYEVLKGVMSEHEVKQKMCAIFGVSPTAIDKRKKALMPAEE